MSGGNGGESRYISLDVIKMLRKLVRRVLHGEAMRVDLLDDVGGRSSAIGSDRGSAALAWKPPVGLRWPPCSCMRMGWSGGSWDGRADAWRLANDQPAAPMAAPCSAACPRRSCMTVPRTLFGEINLVRRDACVSLEGQNAVCKPHFLLSGTTLDGTEWMAQTLARGESK